MKKNLLTIGDISKRTGCSTKSLRYYDSIGVLKPAYIDAKTNYRYYTFEQTRVVEILQLCVVLDINLKDVKKICLKNDNTINYSDLIAYGKKITKEKILNLQETLTFLDTFQDEIERLNSYNNDEEREFNINEKYYFALPFFEDEMNNNYYNLLNTLFTDCINQNLLLKNDYGIVININNNESKKFVVAQVDERHKDLENVIKIKSGQFLCKKTSEININKIANMFSHIKSNNKIIIITPCYSYDFSNPYFEAKCLLEY